MIDEENSTILHAEHPTNPEFTCCGIAYDAYDSGDVNEPVKLAGVGDAGDVVTCLDCRRTVREMREVKMGRLPAKAKGK